MIFTLLPLGWPKELVIVIEGPSELESWIQTDMATKACVRMAIALRHTISPAKGHQLTQLMQQHPSMHVEMLLSINMPEGGLQGKREREEVFTAASMPNLLRCSCTPSS
jgi:hypothetical protein